MTSPIAPEKLAQLVEFAEARAYADLLRAAPREWNWRAEESEASTVLVAPTLDIPLFNRVIGLGLLTPAREEMIETIVNDYATAGVRNFAIQVSPVARPPQTKEWLAARNLVLKDRWAKVYRSDEPVIPTPTSLRIDRTGIEHAGVFAMIACAAFRMPDFLQPWLGATVGRTNWYHYLAWNGAHAVAGAAMYVRDGIAWLGVAGTHPAHRRMGAQGALMARRIQDGIQLGCKWLVTETGEDTPERPNSSYHNMMRNGFILAYQRPNYMRAEE